MGDKTGSINPVTLTIKSDGVYLQINKLGGGLVTRMDVMRIVEENRIRDIDFTAIATIFKNESSVFEVLISHNTDVLISPESAKVNISPDRLMATVTFLPPINSVELLTVDKLKAILAENKVIYGIDDTELRECFKDRQYNRQYVAAKGTPPVDGINGHLIYHFNTAPKNLRPRERDDGTVDFKDLDLIEIVHEGAVLIEGIPPVEGRDGIDVLGKAISHKIGKPYPNIFRTKNTHFSEDGNVLHASVSGQLVFKNNRAEVFPVLQISGDVNNSTGNIDFVGSVVIAGAVLTGFTVKAQGNIEVHGVVEGGNLTAGENIVLLNGILGEGIANIHAAGGIRAKYIDQCNVYAGGDIYTDYILFSRTRCCGKIELSGKRGLLLGGKTTVKDSITVNTIGADLSPSTVIELGFLPDNYERYKSLLHELDDTKAEYERIENYERQLQIQAKKGIIEGDLDKKKTHNIFSKSYYEGVIADLQNRIADLTPDCSDEQTFVVVNKTLYEGVKVTIGSASISVFEITGRCIIKNDGGKIVIIPTVDNSENSDFI